MSETQTQSYTPAPTPTRGGLSVWVWALVLLVAIGALGAAVAWAGGPNEVAKLAGISNLSLPSFSLPFLGGGSSGGGTPPVTSTLPAPSSAATASTLPIEAQNRMFVEQMESNVALTALVDGRLSSMSLGRPVQSDTWYFFNISKGDGPTSNDVASPEGFDSGVVSAITREQALPATQEMIVKGILGGGYTVAKMQKVQLGSRTATIDITLSGGSLPDTRGRFVCVSKSDGATTYWFVASFEKR